MTADGVIPVDILCPLRGKFPVYRGVEGCGVEWVPASLRGAGASPGLTCAS
jgi:hypothetical protein